MVEFDQMLDASGLTCPLPMLKAKKALSPLSVGQILYIVCTDPGAVKDFQAFCKQTGHALLETRKEGSQFHFLIKKC